jgi:phospholipase C
MRRPGFSFLLRFLPPGFPIFHFAVTSLTRSGATFARVTQESHKQNENPKSETNMKTKIDRITNLNARSRIVPLLTTATALGACLVAQADGGHGYRTNEFDAQLKQNVKHIVVIYQENWSFDSLYGQFPGVNGLQNAFDTLPQLDKTGGYSNYIYVTPQTLNGSADNRFPPGNGQPALPLIPYDFTKYVAASDTTGDIIHRFYHEQLQIDNGLLEPSLGAMDKFVTWSDNPGLVLSYADATSMPEGQLAQKYTICDNFFHSAYGGSFLNHQFLVAAAAPKWEQPIPAGFQSSWDATTRTLNDGHLTIDGQYVVNTTYGAQTPHPSTPANQLLAPINNVDPSRSDYLPTIGNRLDDANVSWKWYSGGWSNAVAGNADSLFQFHHQPFGYYAKYAPYNADGSLNPATTGPAAHLQDEQTFFSDVAHGTLPAVSFIKPLGPDNEHPGYAALVRGQQHVASLVSAIQTNRAYANNTVIIITYDENGGRWDHVAPPVMPDQWGLGTRVPTIIASPFTRGGVIDGNQYETVSILKLIERRFSLAPLSSRDANPSVSDLTAAFRFPSEDQQ